MHSPDWFAIITELIYLRVPMRVISREMGSIMSEQLLRNYRNGGEPLYVRGEALLNFWAKTTGKSVHEVPRQPFVRGHRRARS